MLIDFTVENFLSIRERQTLTFMADKNISHLEEYYVENVAGIRLLKVGLILGANASGKSNVLKALEYLRELMLNPKSSKSESTGCIPFLLDNESQGRNTVFEINFIVGERTYYYRIELNDKYVVSEALKTSHTGKTILSRTTDPSTQLSTVKCGNEFPMKKEYLSALNLNTLSNNTIIGGYLKTNIDSKELRDVHQWFSTYLHRLIMPSDNLTAYVTKKIYNGCIDKDTIIPMLQQADFNVSNLSITKVGSESYDIRLNHNGKSLPFPLESIGTQRYLGLACLLFLLVKSPNCYMIDELDESLHPDLYIHLLLSFCVNAHGSQLIATTHNRELLNNKDLFRNDIIHITDRDDDSATQLYRLSDFGTSVIRDTSNILNAYKAGRLGGIPNLGDYYININNDEA